MKFQEVFKRLNGREATTEDILKFERLTTTLETTPGDAMLAVLVALDHYERLYAGIPASIQDAAQKAASGAAQQAQAEVNKAVAALVPTVEKAVSAGARSAIVRENLGKSAITLGLAGLVVGLIFGVGLLYGARIFAGAESGHLTWPDFWNEVGWSLGLGAAVPGMFLLGFANFEDQTTWWQWLILLAAISVIGIMGYRLALG